MPPSPIISLTHPICPPSRFPPSPSARPTQRSPRSPTHDSPPQKDVEAVSEYLSETLKDSWLPSTPAIHFRGRSLSLPKQLVSVLLAPAQAAREGIMVSPAQRVACQGILTVSRLVHHPRQSGLTVIRPPIAPSATRRLRIAAPGKAVRAITAAPRNRRSGAGVPLASPRCATRAAPGGAGPCPSPRTRARRPRGGLWGRGGA